jgi:hypothetical protein
MSHSMVSAMKAFLCLSLALLAIAPASAQVFRPHLDRRAVERAPAGNEHRGNDGRSRSDWQGHSNWGGRDYGYGRTSVYVGYQPFVYDTSYYGGYYGYPAYSYGYYDYAGSGTTTGLFLGALAGGIIGNNSRAFHHDAWLGALWGAGVGSAIGNAVETNRSAIVYAQPTIAPASTAIATQAPAAAAQPATIINNYYGTATPMAAANSLFGR